MTSFITLVILLFGAESFLRS